MKIPIVYTTIQEAINIVEPGDRVYVHSSAQTPVCLLKELARQQQRLKGTELVFISVYGDIEVIKPEYADYFHVNSLFVSQSIRSAVNEGHADYVPVFL